MQPWHPADVAPVACASPKQETCGGRRERKLAQLLEKPQENGVDRTGKCYLVHSEGSRSAQQCPTAKYSHRIRGVSSPKSIPTKCLECPTSGACPRVQSITKDSLECPAQKVLFRESLARPTREYFHRIPSRLPSPKSIPRERPAVQPRVSPKNPWSAQPSKSSSVYRESPECPTGKYPRRIP